MVEVQFSIVSPSVDWLMFRLFFFFLGAHICGTSRISILYAVLRTISTIPTPSKAQHIPVLFGESISQNNESSCFTLVALVHCVLRATSLSLDPPTEAAFPAQKTIAAGICTKLRFPAGYRNTGLP